MARDAPFLAALLVALVGCVPEPRPPPSPTCAPTAAELHLSPNIEAAREMNEQGVRAFAESRYRDALLFFGEARRLGGPASQLWNQARCLQKLDEPDQAARMIEGYLAQAELSKDERAEAENELRTLEGKRSIVSVLTIPPGAAVTLDGKTMGQAPASTVVAPGTHTIAIKLAGHREHTRQIDAKFGKAVVVEVELEKGK